MTSDLSTWPDKDFDKSISSETLYEQRAPKVMFAFVLPTCRCSRTISDLNSNVTNQSDLGLVLWPVRELEVDMSECSLNLGQLLDLSPAAVRRCRAPWPSGMSPGSMMSTSTE
jgi:hypothetical protein